MTVDRIRAELASAIDPLPDVLWRSLECTETSWTGLEEVHPDSAGIDVGKRKHYVAVDPSRFEEPVRNFGTFMQDLEAMAEWLSSCGVRQVAMESTGVYWIPVFEVLDRAGFDVHLVNPRATKQVSGRKSDVLDCQWIRQLMSYGLLRGAFRAPGALCPMRSYVRQRGQLIRDRSRTVQHMQKALGQMNVQMDNVLSDIMGKTGQLIVRAIVAGERDGAVLAKCRTSRLKTGPLTYRNFNGYKVVPCKGKPAPQEWSVARDTFQADGLCDLIRHRRSRMCWMPTTFRPYQPDQLLLLSPDLREWLAPGHLAHHVSDLIDALELSAIYAPYEGDGRRNAPYEPSMMVKILIYAYATGVFSSRAIARKLEEDVAFRVLGAGNLPQHRTICKFRRRHLEDFERMFVEVVRLAREMGVVRFGTLSVDGTKVRAKS